MASCLYYIQKSVENSVVTYLVEEVILLLY